MAKRFEIDIGTLARTKAEAIIRGDQFFLPRRPCCNGHAAPRYVKRNRCLECQRATVRRSNRVDYIRHLEKRLAQSRLDQTMRRKSGTDWGSRNPERFAELKSQWRGKNHAANRAHGMQRKAVKLHAMPPWITKEHKREMRALYQRAVDLTRLTGTKHEVDHEVPLQGRIVVGLHVPWNMRVVPATVNNRRPRIWNPEGAAL